MSMMRPHSAVDHKKLPDSFGLNEAVSETSSRVNKISPRPATAGIHSSRSNTSSVSPKQLVQVDSESDTDARIYFDSFKKDEQRDLIAQSTASWLLSPDFRGQAGLPCGLISNLTLSQKQHLTVLFPKENNVPALEYREIHQIVRELTSGIFGVNQMPSLKIEPNYDLSSTCQLPLAYKNTTVGQILISVDYAMKSLWHGACVSRSVRTKLAERWRAFLDVSSVNGEVTATTNVMSEFDKADFVRCVMTCHVTKVQANAVENVVAIECDYDVTSAIILPDDDFISPTQMQRLRRRLRHQMNVIRKGLVMDSITRRNLALMKLITSLSLIFVALRRRLMRVPDVDKLLKHVQSDNPTESELPPFAIGKPGDHPCEIFTVDAKGERRLITHCHGEIQIDVDTSSLLPLTNNQWCQNVQTEAINSLQAMLTKPRPEYTVPSVTLDGKDHYVIHIPLTTYYSASPPIPRWLHSRYQILATLRPKRLPMSDIQLAELFKQTFGMKKALANKTTEGGLKLCACRGLIAPFIALMKKSPSATLLSPDLQGLTLLHHACIQNRPDILSILLGQNPNLNTRRTEIGRSATLEKERNNKTLNDFPEERSGPTAMIFATRCGALPCVTILLATKCNPVLSDGEGRSAIHHAAIADQTPIIRSLLRRHPTLLETPITGGDNSTPLLVAASNGSLNTLKFLIHYGASVMARDLTGDGVIERAALNYHADVIQYFIEGSNNNSKMKFDNLRIWDRLVDLLKSKSVFRQDAALRCLEVLLHRKAEYWHPLHDAGAVAPLVELLQSYKRCSKPGIEIHDISTKFPTPIRSLSCSVICLMSEQLPVRKAVASSGAIPTLISLLKPIRLTPRARHIKFDLNETTDERFELQSRSSVVLSDLAYVDASCIAEHGGIPPLVELLQLDIVDVLVNAVTTLSSLCQGDKSGSGEIQDRIMECGAASFLVEFLCAKDDTLQAATADAIASICHKNEAIQNEFVAIGTYKPLVAILRGHCISAQLKAASAINSMSENNLYSQRQAVLEGAPDALCRLFLIWSETVQEQGASALWSLAGKHPQNQRTIANRIGTKQIIEMLISKSDTLQWIGCQAVAAISKDLFSGQARLVKDGTIPPLIRLLRLTSTSKQVTIAVLDAIKSLCSSVAHLNNKNSQEAIAEEGAIELLLDRLWLSIRDDSMQVDFLLCLAYLVTGCQSNEDRLAAIDTFDYDIALELLNSPDKSVKYRASLALAIFCYNRLPQQQRILKLGGIPYLALETLLASNDPLVRAGIAFQLVVLARVVTHISVVDASAKGIIILTELLEQSVDDEIILASERYIASLAHTRAGVPEAIVSTGAIEKLLVHLKSDNDLVRTGAAQALGYLSYNRTASRELMSVCRSAEGLYESLLDNLGEDGKISDEFLAEFKRQRVVGLPIPKAPLSQRKSVSNSTCLTKKRKINSAPPIFFQQTGCPAKNNHSKLETLK